MHTKSFHLFCRCHSEISFLFGVFSLFIVFFLSSVVVVACFFSVSPRPIKRAKSTHKQWFHVQIQLTHRIIHTKVLINRNPIVERNYFTVTGSKNIIRTEIVYLHKPIDRSVGVPLFSFLQLLLLSFSTPLVVFYLLLFIFFFFGFGFGQIYY